jgi:hypothetical protein
LEHHARYTDQEWGWDYDYALDDQTTRVRRVYVKSEGEMATAIAPWPEDLSRLQEPGKPEGLYFFHINVAIRIASASASRFPA